MSAGQEAQNAEGEQGGSSPTKEVGLQAGLAKKQEAFIMPIMYAILRNI